MLTYLLHQLLVFGEDATVRLIVTVIEIFSKIATIKILTQTTCIYFLQCFVFLLLNCVFANLFLIKGLEAANMSFTGIIVRW